jgi:hypothetical protein
MRTLNDIHGAPDAEIDSYLGDVSAVDFRRHVAEFSGEQRNLRDWFAGMALQGVMVNAQGLGEMDPEQRAGLLKQVAGLIYETSDAMLAARKENP